MLFGNMLQDDALELLCCCHAHPATPSSLRRGRSGCYKSNTRTSSTHQQSIPSRQTGRQANEINKPRARARAGPSQLREGLCVSACATSPATARCDEEIWNQRSCTITPSRSFDSTPCALLTLLDTGPRILCCSRISHAFFPPPTAAQACPPHFATIQSAVQRASRAVSGPHRNYLHLSTSAAHTC